MAFPFPALYALHQLAFRPIKVRMLSSFALSLALVISCKKETDKQPDPLVTPPVVNTKPATRITAISAVSGGELTNAVTINDKGVVWGTDSSNLTISSANKIRNGPGAESFTDTLKNLAPNTTYYIKAFAVYGSAVAYGAVRTFTTLPAGPNVYIAGYHGGSAA